MSKYAILIRGYSNNFGYRPKPAKLKVISLISSNRFYILLGKKICVFNQRLIQVHYSIISPTFCGIVLVTYRDMITQNSVYRAIFAPCIFSLLHLQKVSPSHSQFKEQSFEFAQLRNYPTTRTTVAKIKLGEYFTVTRKLVDVVLKFKSRNVKAQAFLFKQLLFIHLFIYSLWLRQF